MPPARDGVWFFIAGPSFHWPPYSNRAAIGRHQSGNLANCRNTLQSSRRRGQPIVRSQSSQSGQPSQSSQSGATTFELLEPIGSESSQSGTARMPRLKFMPDWPDWRLCQIGQIGLCKIDQSRVQLGTARLHGPIECNRAIESIGQIDCRAASSRNLCVCVCVR